MRRDKDYEKIARTVKKRMLQHPDEFDEKDVEKVRKERHPSDEDGEFGITMKIRHLITRFNFMLSDVGDWLTDHGVTDFLWNVGHYLLIFLIWCGSWMLAVPARALFVVWLKFEEWKADDSQKERDAESSNEISPSTMWKIFKAICYFGLWAYFLHFDAIDGFSAFILTFMVWMLVQSLNFYRLDRQFHFCDVIKAYKIADMHFNNPFTMYYKLPKLFLLRDWELESSMRQNIDKTRIFKDKHYGIVREINMDLPRNVAQARYLTDVWLVDYGLLPQSPAGSQASASQAYYSLAGIGKQSMDYLIGLINSDQLIDKIATDSRVNACYAELADQIADRKQAEAERLAKQKEEQEEAAMKAYCADHNLPAGAVGVLMTIRKHRDAWGFGYWRLAGDNIAGNNRYFAVRCKLLQGRALKDVARVKPAIESALRRQVLLQPLSDRGSFKLIVLLDSNLPKYSLKLANLAKYGSDNQIFLGDSLTGLQTPAWNNQAQMFGVFGKSGSGKTVTILSLIASLLCLKNYDYRNLIICSSSKVGDFSELKKAGAYVGSGLDECLKTATAVLNECKRREKMFESAGVSNLWEFNKKYPNKKMSRILYVHDEIENALNSSDTKKSKQLESVLVEGLNIYRSSGVVFVCGAQNALKSQIGVVMDKLTTRFIGNANKNVLDQFDGSLSEYYQTADSPQGRFFITTDNLKMKNALPFGSGGLVLLQTPFVSDLKASNLPDLVGQEFMDKVSGAGEGLSSSGSVDGDSTEEELL